MSGEIRMQETREGAPNGIEVMTHREGETYEVGTHEMSADLAETYLAAGWAEAVSGEDSAGGDGPSSEAAESGGEESEGEEGGEEGGEEYTYERVGDSPFYRIMTPDGDPLLDGDDEEVRLHGEDNAEAKIQELNE